MKHFIKVTNLLVVALVMILVVGAVPAFAAFTADLKLGQTHPQVKELQQYLNNKGYTVATFGDGSPGYETSYMGPATVEALKRFQSDNGIEATGMVGVQTRIVLNRTGFVTTSPVVNNQNVSIASTTIKTNTPSSASTFNTTGPSPFVLADLYPGMTHPQTLTLQRLLNTFGYKVATVGDGSPGYETTYMGPATVEALKRFQSTNQISPTGVVGPLTKIALLRTQLDYLLKARQGVSSTGSTILTTNSTTKATSTTTTRKKRSGGGGGGGGSSSGGGGGSSTPAPVASVSVSSGTVTSGAAVTVTWSSTNATSCTGTNFSTGSATSGSVVVNPTVTTTYTLSCTGSGGTDTETASVTVSDNPAPTATLTVSASTVASGASVTVTWSSTNATSCTGTNFSTGSATSGSTVVNPTASTTYTVSCTGTGGSDDDSSTVTVVPAPVATFEASPSSVTSGASVTLTWSSTNATSCTGTNFSTGSATSGSVVVNPTATTTYTLTCTGTGGSDVETEIVTVSSNPAPTASLSTSASSVASGASVTLTWSSVNATSCTGTNFSTGSATSGSVVVNPNTSTTYTLSCAGPGGSDDDVEVVTVVPAPVATLSTSASSVASGASVTLTWSSTNATSCTGTNFSTGSATSGSVVVNPTASTTYTVTCTGVGGSDDDSRTVTVAPVPVATLSVSSSTVASGASITVTWSSTNATSCTGTNFSTGSATSGSVVVNPTASTTYTVTCTGTGGTDDDSRTVTVVPAPVATLGASQTSVASGASVTLTWSSTNATSCTGTNFSTGSATSGSVVVNPTASTTYSVTCNGIGGSDVENVTVTVVPAPVATLSVSSSTIASGASVTITWSSTNATSCTGTNFSTGSATSGSTVVNPTASTTYTVSCTGVGGSDDDSRTVTVVPAPVASLSVSSSSVASGASVTVTWSSTNATSCTGTNFSTGSATSGSTVVNPTVFTTYTVTCTGTGGTDDDSRTVTVSGGSSDITISASASRTSGVAPLAVFFDATGTTDPGTTMPFHELEYRWNFGDTAGGATWNYGSRPGVSSKNEATGGVAAHVFETPGTYTVTLDVVGESGTESTDFTITVTDPDTVFSGTNTRCISRTGNFTGCPSGAQQVTTTDINTVISHIATGRRILFRKGETWSSSINMGGINGPGIIGSYGTGASPIFTGINIGSSNTSDWRVMDIDFVRETGNRYATAVELVHPSSRMTFLRIKATGAGTTDDGTEIAFAMNIYSTPTSVNQQVEHAIVDSEITAGKYSFYGAGDKIAFLGNYFESLGGGQHVYRSFYANKGVNSNNTFVGGGSSSGNWGPLSLVKQHAPDHPEAYSEYLHWSDNQFSPTSVFASLGFGSENNITDQRVRNVVVERNRFEATYDSQIFVNLSSGSDFTVRNNLFIMDRIWGTGVQVIEDTTGPATSNAHIYNNTFYKSDGGGQGMTAIQVLDAGVSAVVRNNIGYAPNATNPVMLSVSGASVTQSNNSTDTQLRTVSPNFSSATPVTIQHFELLSGSYGRNSGYALPIFSDILRRTRPVGSYDMGALEAQ